MKRILGSQFFRLCYYFYMPNITIKVDFWNILVYVCF